MTPATFSTHLKLSLWQRKTNKHREIEYVSYLAHVKLKAKGKIKNTTAVIRAQTWELWMLSTSHDFHRRPLAEGLLMVAYHSDAKESLLHLLLTHIRYQKKLHKEILFQQHNSKRSENLRKSTSSSLLSFRAFGWSGVFWNYMHNKHNNRCTMAQCNINI